MKPTKQIEKQIEKVFKKNLVSASVETESWLGSGTPHPKDKQKIGTLNVRPKAIKDLATLLSQETSKAERQMVSQLKEIDERLARYRCGKHWLLRRKIDDIINQLKEE